MKKYIKQIGNRIELGGQVATPEMLAHGWFEYDGPIPESLPNEYSYYTLEDGNIVIKLDVEREVEAKIKESKKYLADTDYKMTVDYFAQLTHEQQQELTEKRDAARKFIREHSKQVNTTTI